MLVAELPNLPGDLSTHTRNDPYIISYIRHIVKFHPDINQIVHDSNHQQIRAKNNILPRSKEHGARQAFVIGMLIRDIALRMPDLELELELLTGQWTHLGEP